MDPAVLRQVQLLEVAQLEFRKILVGMHDGAGPGGQTTHHHRYRGLLVLVVHAVIDANSMLLEVTHYETEILPSDHVTSKFSRGQKIM